MLDRPNGAPEAARALAQLIAATGRGDRKAFAALYAATSAKLYGTALAVLRRRDLAEDVVQEAYVRIWHNAASYDPARGSPITWMATIVRHLAIDAVRSRDARPMGEESELLAIPADVPDPLEEMAALQRQRRALALLKELDPMKRRLVIAAYLHGESREQLAERFGTPVNTIKAWLRRAILEMRAAFDDEDRSVA
jgi:RNA polymerase sigma-70 factor (ECF subfamily)